MPFFGQILLPMLLIAILAFARNRWARIAAALYLCLYPIAWVYTVMRDGVDHTRIWGTAIVIMWALTCLWLRRGDGDGVEKRARDEHSRRMPRDADYAGGARPSTHELRCAECGYDLRGLDGDVIRCPECGRVAERTDSQLSTAELAVDYQVSIWSSGIFPAVVLLAIALLTVFVRGVFPGAWRSFFAPVSAVSVMVWLGLLVRSWWSFGWRAGWGKVVIFAHVCALLIPSSAGLFVLAFCVLILNVYDWIGWALAILGAMVASAAVWGCRRLRYNLAIYDRVGAIRAKHAKHG